MEEAAHRAMGNRIVTTVDEAHVETEHRERAVPVAARRIALQRFEVSVTEEREDPSGIADVRRWDDEVVRAVEREKSTKFTPDARRSSRA